MLFFFLTKCSCAKSPNHFYFFLLLQRQKQRWAQTASQIKFCDKLSQFMVLKIRVTALPIPVVKHTVAQRFMLLHVPQQLQHTGSAMQKWAGKAFKCLLSPLPVGMNHKPGKKNLKNCAGLWFVRTYEHELSFFLVCAHPYLAVRGGGWEGWFYMLFY